MGDELAQQFDGRSNPPTKDELTDLLLAQTTGDQAALSRECTRHPFFVERRLRQEREIRGPLGFAVMALAQKANASTAIWVLDGMSVRELAALEPRQEARPSVGIPHKVKDFVVADLDDGSHAHGISPHTAKRPNRLSQSAFANRPGPSLAPRA